MRSTSANRRSVRPRQVRKTSGLDVRAEDLYATFAQKGEGMKQLRPWSELSDTEQKRWEAVASSLTG
jgi:hypothetical protein